MKQAIRTELAPAAIGPYTQGILFGGGNLVATAGQIGIDPENGQLVSGGIAAETRRALENIRAVLEAGGSGMAHVVKVTVFLTDMNDFAAMNAVYETFFSAPFPARSACGVAALPKGAKVEFEALAVVGPAWALL